MPGGLGRQALLPESFFVVLEGGEGSGKTSIMSSLSAALGPDAVITREPGGTREGLALRALVLSEQGFDWDPAAELLVMFAARVQHVKHVIEPALRSGRIVVCDRFLGSTLAYQGAGRGLSVSMIRQLHAHFAGGLMPDLTVFLDVDPRLGLSRSLRRLGETALDEGRFEALDLGFHERVRADFLAQALADPGRSLVVDASRPLDIVISEVVAEVHARIARRKADADQVQPIQGK